MDKRVVFVGDIVEDNGKTIKENNLDKLHNLAVGTKVYVETEDNVSALGTLKLKGVFYIAKQTRDCDETPLYSLSRYSEAFFEDLNIPEMLIRFMCMSGYAEDYLMPVEGDIDTFDMDKLHEQYVQFLKDNGVQND